MFKNGLAQYLDRDFVLKLQNEDFYGRLWELELAEWFMLTEQKMVPTNGKGPDFCIDLNNGKKVWVEAVLARPDEELDRIQEAAFKSDEAYNTPREQTALRYTTSLAAKAEKIRDKYQDIISDDDYVIIAISAFQPSSMWSDIDIFMLSILPIEHQVVHFPTDDKPLDKSIVRATHTVSREYVKDNGSKVPKEFLYPGTHFPFIDGVMFSEASNLQGLLGAASSRFDNTTNRPHVFANYSGKELPEDFTNGFYFHKWAENSPFASLEMREPTVG